MKQKIALALSILCFASGLNTLFLIVFITTEPDPYIPMPWVWTTLGLWVAPVSTMFWVIFRHTGAALADFWATFREIIKLMAEAIERKL